MGHHSKLCIELVYYLTLGSICHNSLLGQKRWFVVLDCCMLKPVPVPLPLQLSDSVITAL